MNLIFLKKKKIGFADFFRKNIRFPELINLINRVINFLLKTRINLLK